MSSMTGPTYSVDNQITFIVQWFRTWSEIQKDDFVEILAQKLAPGNNMNGLVNGMQKLDTESRRVSLFSCQVKLFNEWWPTWSEGEKENLTTRLKESDPKFWVAVQDETSGKRKKLEDDFLLLISNCENTVENDANTKVTTVVPEEAKITVVVNGTEEDVTLNENGTDTEEISKNEVMENGESHDQSTVQNGSMEEDKDKEIETGGSSG